MGSIAVPRSLNIDIMNVLTVFLSLLVSVTCLKPCPGDTRGDKRCNHDSTPLALGALNIMSKIIGGAYLLVAMIWRDSRKPGPNPPPQRPALQSLPPLRPLPPPSSDRGRQIQRPDSRGAM